MPARVYLSRGWWFYAPKGSAWIKLAHEEDRPGALRAYADLMAQTPRQGCMAALIERYRRDELPKKAAKTQREQERQLGRLTAVFGAMSPASITSHDVAGYLDSSPAPVSANREIALLSHVFTKAVRWGLAPGNPCRGVERNKEAPRTRYVTHEEFAAVLEAAPAALQVLMALAYVTGQREGDLIRLRRKAITADGVEFQQRKTGKKLIVSWSPALAWSIEQAGKLPREGCGSLFVVCQRDGQPYSESGIQTAWQKLMRQCIADGVIAERFTFHDLRAKAGSDAKDGRLLGHMDPRTLRRVYLRKPEKVQPVC